MFHILHKPERDFCHTIGCL